MRTVRRSWRRRFVSPLIRLAVELRRSAVRLRFKIRRDITRRVKIHRRNLSLLMLFATFCASIAVYAFIYYATYLQNHRSLAMNTDIDAAQNTIWHRALAQEYQSNKELRALRLIRELSYARHQGAALVTTKVEHGRATEKVLSAGRAKFVFTEDRATGTTKLAIYELDKVIVSGLSWEVKFTDDAGINEQLDMFPIAVGLASSTEFAHFVPWTFADFFYFSAITATTVGYGDILPNATSVRVTVTTQVLWSSFLLVIAINISIEGIGSRGKKLRPGRMLVSSLWRSDRRSRRNSVVRRRNRR